MKNTNTYTIHQITSFITSHNEAVDKLIADFGLDVERGLMPSHLVNTLQSTLWANNTEEERDLLADLFNAAWMDFCDDEDDYEWQDFHTLYVYKVESALKAAYARVWADTVAKI